MCVRNGISASISSLPCDDVMSDMEREQYRKQIRELEGKVDDAHTDDDDEKEAESVVSSRSS